MSFICLLALGSRLVSRLCAPRGRASALSPDASRSGPQGALWHSGLHNRKRIQSSAAACSLRLPAPPRPRACDRGCESDVSVYITHTVVEGEFHATWRALLIAISSLPRELKCENVMKNIRLCMARFMHRTGHTGVA